MNNLNSSFIEDLFKLGETKCFVLKANLDILESKKGHMRLVAFTCNPASWKQNFVIVQNEYLSCVIILKNGG